MVLLERNRLEAFSDGVFAILITLLILEIKVPHFESNSVADIVKGLKTIAPKFIAFLVSFIVIAVYWVSHHAMFARLKYVSGKILWTNLFSILIICVIPFTSALVGDYPHAKLIVAIYAFHIFIIGVLYAFIDRLILSSKELLINTEVEHFMLKKHIVGNALNLLACMLSFVWIPGVIFTLIISRLLFILSQFKIIKAIEKS